MLYMKHILVTGGAGYIGSACTRALLDAGHTVTVVDNLSHGDTRYVDPRAEFVQADIRDTEAMDALFSAHDFDTVMHFAALKAVGESEERPIAYYENNIAGTIALLSCMVAHNVRDIVFSSSAAVYAPKGENGVYTETDTLGSLNIYGACKVIEERLIQELARTGVLQKYAILRYFNVAGDAGLHYIDSAPENVFPRLARAAAGNETFHIYGTDYDTRDGTCIRDYVHLADLVDAHLRALEHSTSGVWNIGTSNGTSVRELIAAFEAATKTPLSARETSRRAGDPPLLLADSTRAVQELGWQPKHTLDDMVRSTLHYLS